MASKDDDDFNNVLRGAEALNSESSLEQIKQDEVVGLPEVNDVDESSQSAKFIHA